MNQVWNISENKATYILRYFLPRPPMVDIETQYKRLVELIEFCKRTKTQAVQFYVNLRDDWYYMPNSPEHTRQWAEEFKQVAKELHKHGISYQLNFQDLIGHQSGGMDMRKDYPWGFMVNQHGEENLGCPCPIGPEFRRVMGQQLEAWAATEPDVFWIDDDFRHFNHGLNQYGYDWYCFCPLHIEGFSKKHNTSIGREELVKAILRHGKPSWERIAWMDYINETQKETCAWISSIVHRISPNTRMAQMTSLPDHHAVEGRNWGDFLSALCGEGYKPMTRPGLAPYSEVLPLEFLHAYMWLNQAMTNTYMQYKGEIDFCPEIENSRYTRWAKSYSGTRFQLWLGQLMGCPAITLALHDLEGSPLDEEPLYEELLIRERPVVDTLTGEKLNEFTGRGVALLTDPEIARKVQIESDTDMNQLMQPDRTWDTLLLQMGVPACYFSVEDALKQEVVALDGRTAWIPDDVQMKQLLSHALLLDAKAAEVLVKRGFGGDIGIREVGFRDHQLASELFHGLVIGGMTEKRMPIRSTAGNWGVLSPEDGTQRVSTVIVPSGERFPGTVIFENSLGGRVAAYAGCNDIANEFFNHARVSWILAVLQWLSRDSFPLYIKAQQRLLTLRRDSDNRILLAFANFGADPLEFISGSINVQGEIKSVKALSGDGKWVAMDRAGFKPVQPGKYQFSIPVNLNLYQWHVMILEQA